MTRRGLLADRRIRLVVAALVASGWADGFLPVALSFTVLRVTGSVARLGLVLAVQGGFALLLTLAGGLAGDRFPRRRIMVVSLATRTVVAAVMAATLLAGMASFPLLLAMAVIQQLRLGWAEFAKRRWLWLLASEWTVFSLVILAPVNVLGPSIAQRYLGGASAWGIIGSCLSLGAIAGQILAGHARMPARPALVIACLLPLMTGEALALGLGLPLAVVALATAVSGLAIGVQAVIFPTAMQMSVPPDVLARVTSIDLLTSEGGQPAGYILAGPVGAVVGPHAYLAFAAIGIIAASVAFALLPSLRVRVANWSRTG